MHNYMCFDFYTYGPIARVVGCSVVHTPPSSVGNPGVRKAQRVEVSTVILLAFQHFPPVHVAFHRPLRMNRQLHAIPRMVLLFSLSSTPLPVSSSPIVEYVH